MAFPIVANPLANLNTKGFIEKTFNHILIENKGVEEISILGLVGFHWFGLVGWFALRSKVNTIQRLIASVFFTFFHFF